ncbi:HAD family hydrolase [Methylobacterium sp. Leaf104]|uniref:HAD family hydrolase n=1 Tax=Methylobacterium TaxID=407 RepID=UPI0006F2A7CE|nr:MULTISPECIES: HAD family phosphatase [Methylobacterium]KQP31726.1 HAD family hydrolase [Methylobacterium sp. Leaf104]MCI9880639.1 HAD family phosphatase [Methylobacterium goesingense]
MTKTVRAVIFDIDGTLLDSVDLHAQAWVDAFAHFGVTVSHDQARSQIGKGGDQLLPVFLDEARIAREGETIEAYRSDLFKRDYLSKVKPFPGVSALFEHLKGQGLTVALASSGKAAEVEHYQSLMQVEDLTDVVVTSDDVARSKPFPDIFQAALEKLAPLTAAQAVVIGDTPYDAEAAEKAGLRTIGVLCGGFPEADLGAAGCIAIYRDPQDLLDGYVSSPLAT